MPALKRFSRIAAGYVAASIVAGVIALLGILIVHIGFVALSPRALGELVQPFAIASAVAGATALLPTLPVGIYAERHAKRALAWYTRAGIGVSLVALALYVIASELATRSITNASQADIAFVVQLAICVMIAGLCSGATYWAIAGRHAGKTAEPAKH